MLWWWRTFPTSSCSVPFQLGRLQIPLQGLIPLTKKMDDPTPYKTAVQSTRMSPVDCDTARPYSSTGPHAHYPRNGVSLRRLWHRRPPAVTPPPPLTLCVFLFLFLCRKNRPIPHAAIDQRQQQTSPGWNWRANRSIQPFSPSLASLCTGSLSLSLSLSFLGPIPRVSQFTKKIITGAVMASSQPTHSLTHIRSLSHTHCLYSVLKMISENEIFFWKRENVFYLDGSALAHFFWRTHTDLPSRHFFAIHHALRDGKKTTVEMDLCCCYELEQLYLGNYSFELRLSRVP